MSTEGTITVIVTVAVFTRDAVPAVRNCTLCARAPSGSRRPHGQRADGDDFPRRALDDHRVREQRESHANGAGHGVPASARLRAEGASARSAIASAKAEACQGSGDAVPRPRKLERATGIETD